MPKTYKLAECEKKLDRAVALLVKYSEMCACEGLGNLEQDSKQFLTELKEVDDEKV